MAIFPRFESGRVDVATPETPAPPALTRGAESLVAAGQALMKGGIETAGVVRKRKLLEDDVTVQQRYMQASSEIEETEERLKQGGTDALRAREIAEELVSKRTPEWAKGLDAEASFKLESKLFDRTLAFRSTAAHVENRAVVDGHKADMLSRERALSEAIAKRPELFGTNSPEGSPEFQNLMEGMDLGVRTGAETKERAAAERLRILKNAALDLGHSIISHSPETLLGMAKSSGFLQHLTAGEEAQLRSQAETQKRTIARDAEHKEDRQRQAIERFENEQREYFEADFERSLRGDPGAPAPSVSHLDQLNSLRLLSGEKYRFYRDSIENRLVEGGPGDATVIRDLGLRVMTVETNPDILSTESQVMAAVRAKTVPFKIGMSWLQHLRTKKSQEDLPLTLKQQNQSAKALVKEALTIAGPHHMTEKLTGIVQPILTEAIEELERNAAQGYPRPPLQIYFEKKAEWQARAKLPAKQRVNDIRRSLGIPPATKDDGGEAVLSAREKLNQEWQATPPGDTAKRDRLRERARRLKELYDIERQIEQLGPAAGGSSGAAAPTARPQPQGGGTAPVPRGSR